MLDETDSGLDIDALKTVAEGVNAMRSPDRAIIVVTHYQRLLNYIDPGLRPRAAGRAHRAIGRQGAGAAPRRKRLRLDRSRASVDVARSAYPNVTKSSNERNPPALKLAHYAAEYHRAVAHAPSQPRWVAQARESAIAQFERLGFPTTRLEQWRFTSVAPIAERTFALASDGAGRM